MTRPGQHLPAVAVQAMIDLQRPDMAGATCRVGAMSPASVDRGPLCAPVNRLRSVTLVVPSGVADWRHGSPIGRQSTVVGSISYCRFHLGGLSSPQVTGSVPLVAERGRVSMGQWGGSIRAMKTHLHIGHEK